MIVPLYERYVRHLSLRPSRQLKNGSNADQGRDQNHVGRSIQKLRKFVDLSQHLTDPVMDWLKLRSPF
jgi:hypothetical protein